MIASHTLLAAIAEKTGIKVPDTAHLEDFNINLYPHWHVFLTAQYGTPLPSPSAAWENAKIVLSIPEDKILTTTLKDLRQLGFAGV